MSFTGFYWVSLGITGFYWVLWGFTSRCASEFCGNIQNILHIRFKIGTREDRNGVGESRHSNRILEQMLKMLPGSEKQD